MKGVPVIEVGPFGVQVALFSSEEERADHFKDVLGLDVETKNACFGVCSKTPDENGVCYFAITITDDANLGTLAHECSHLVDFLCDEFGVPLDVENTEIRAYMIQSIILDAAHHFGFPITREDADTPTK
jgi:hypothetical protein